jgi:hypothetical protein
VSPNAWLHSISSALVSDKAISVLGGGVAVNSALWWKPHPGDWDRNFPDGWKSTDMAKSTDKVFQRIPGVSH